MNSIRTYFGKRVHLFTLLCICLLTVLAYLPTFTNDFQMGWDDQWMVKNDFTSNGLDWEKIKESFLTGVSGQYDPINQLMYTFLYSIGGFNPMLFHTASLLLHLCNAGCVYVLIYTILKDCTSLGSERNYRIVLICTLLFAIHPLQVESVAWISASKIVLSTLFYLLSGITLIRFFKTDRYRYYVCTALFFVLSYLCKEACVGFPLWATLICLWYGITPRKARFWKVLLPLYVISLFMGLHTVFVVTSYNQYLEGETYVWWQRVVFCFYAMVTYVFKWMMPLHLNWMYHYPVSIGESLPLWILPYPLLFCVLVYSLWGWIKNHYVASALLFSLVHLVFVLHLIVLPRGAVIADRYMYLPLLGLNAILAYVLTEPRLATKRKVVTFGLIALYLISTGMTYQRVGDWKDSPTLKGEKTIDSN